MKKMYINLFLLFTATIFLGTNLSAQCDPGTLQTIGMITVAPGETFDIIAENAVVPADPGGYGWMFDNTGTDGTGGIETPLTLFGSAATETFDNDLGGVLSFNGLPPFQGTWVIRGFAYTDNADLDNTTCGITADSLVVDFGTIMSVCNAGTLQTAGTEIVCKGADLIVETTGSESDATGGFAYLFLNDATGGTGALDGNFILRGVTEIDTFDEDLGGVLSANNFPIFAGTWVVKSASFSNTNDPFGSICSISEDSLIVVWNEEISFSLANDANTSVGIASLIGGTAPFSYAWSNGETTETATDLSDGDLTLVVTDAGGCTAESSITLVNTSVEDIEGLSSFDLGPNPTSDMMNLSLTFDQKQNIAISITSLDGKLSTLITNEFTDQINRQLDMTAFANGVYLLHISTDNGQYAERIVKY